MFRSSASNLVPGDTNDQQDVFVNDRQTGLTTRVSVDSDGLQADDDSDSWYGGSISADGRYVAFSSWASLVPEDTNHWNDVFVHDRSSGQTSRVSVDSAGNQGSRSSYFGSMSADGRYVAFESLATDLVPGDTNASSDIFVHDRQNGVTTRVSIDSAGVQGNQSSFVPWISADGSCVVFASSASNLVAGDTNASYDVFVHERLSGQTTRVSVDSSDIQSNAGSLGPTISADGRHVAFDSVATNLVPGDTNASRDVFLHDRQSGLTARLSVDSTGIQGDLASSLPAISADGRLVAFDSLAANLVAGDTNGKKDVFVHDRLTGATSRTSVDSAGAQASGDSYNPTISANGLHVEFSSLANDLVSGDSNLHWDVFVHRR